MKIGCLYLSYFTLLWCSLTKFVNSRLTWWEGCRGSSAPTLWPAWRSRPPGWWARDRTAAAPDAVAPPTHSHPEAPGCVPPLQVESTAPGCLSDNSREHQLPWPAQTISKAKRETVYLCNGVNPLVNNEPHKLDESSWTWDTLVLNERQVPSIVADKMRKAGKYFSCPTTSTSLLPSTSFQRLVTLDRSGAAKARQGAKACAAGQASKRDALPFLPCPWLVKMPQTFWESEVRRSAQRFQNSYKVLKRQTYYIKKFAYFWTSAFLALKIRLFINFGFFAP